MSTGNKRSGPGKRRQGHDRKGWTATPEDVAHAWGTLDLTSKMDGLPPPGDYQAVITDVQLYDKPDVLWLKVFSRLVDWDADPEPSFEAIAAEDGSRHSHRVIEGLRLLFRLQAATGAPLEGIDPFDLPDLLEGKRVTLRIAYSMRDGQVDLVVRAILPPQG